MGTIDLRYSSRCIVSYDEQQNLRLAAHSHVDAIEAVHEVRSRPQYAGTNCLNFVSFSSLRVRFCQTYRTAKVIRSTLIVS
jgi:hypothetical protein